MNQVKRFVVCLLILVVNLETEASTLRNSFVDNINSGIKLAESLIGLSNNVADLVSQSFSQNNPKGNRQNARQDNVIVGDVGSQTALDQSMVSGMLKLLGFDGAKIGAAAVNGIIFIAQMIGSMLDGNNDLDTNKNSKQDQKLRENEEIPIVQEDPFDWILRNEKVVEMLNEVRDQNLPDKIIEMIKTLEEFEGETDCIKLLVCKMKPFIWSMQKAVISKIDDQPEVGDEDPKISAKNLSYKAALYKYLPGLDEFKNNGSECEDFYNKCNIF